MDVGMYNDWNKKEEKDKRAMKKAVDSSASGKEKK